MKFYQSSHIFQHPWSTVTQAFWRKYPNDYQSSVYGTDVIERYIDSEGKLHSKRLIISEWNVPSFMSFFFSDPRGYAVEYSIVDPVEKTLTLRSHNINLRSIFSMQENVVYKSHGEGTHLNHETKVVISAYRLLDDSAETWIVGTITEAAKMGLMAMESISCRVEREMKSAFTTIDEISTDAIKSIDTFASDAKRSIDSSMSDAEMFIDLSISDTEQFLDTSIHSLKNSLESQNDLLRTNV